MLCCKKILKVPWYSSISSLHKRLLEVNKHYHFAAYDRPHQDIVDEFTKRDDSEFRYNRNPINMELLVLAPQECGYNQEDDVCKNYYNRVQVHTSGKHIYSSVIHHKSGLILTASTREPWIRTRLYRTNDRCAALNLGRILAHRLKSIGLHHVTVWDPTDREFTSQKVEAFISGLKLEGIIPSNLRAVKMNWCVVQDGESAHHFFKDHDKFVEWLEKKRIEHNERYDVE